MAADVWYRLAAEVATLVLATDNKPARDGEAVDDRRVASRSAARKTHRPLLSMLRQERGKGPLQTGPTGN